MSQRMTARTTENIIQQRAAFMRANDQSTVTVQATGYWESPKRDFDADGNLAAAQILLIPSDEAFILHMYPAENICIIQIDDGIDSGTYTLRPISPSLGKNSVVTFS